MPFKMQKSLVDAKEFYSSEVSRLAEVKLLKDFPAWKRNLISLKTNDLKDKYAKNQNWEPADVALKATLDNDLTKVKTLGTLAEETLQSISSATSPAAMYNIFSTFKTSLEAL